MATKMALQAFNFIKKSEYKKLRDLAAERDEPGYLSKCDDLIGLYDSPGSHLPWNEYVKICLIGGCAQSIESSFAGGDVKGAIACTSFRQSIEKGVCARYVGKEILESFEQTPVPELPPQVVNVLPYVHLMLPRRTVYDAEGDEVFSILVESGKLYADSISEDSQSILDKFFPSEKPAPMELLGSTGIQISTVTAGGFDVFQEFVTPDAKSWHEANVKYAENSKYESPNTEKIVRIAVNSLLVHLYEPELITTDKKRPTRGLGFSGSKKQSLAPTWIGKTFKRKSEGRSPASKDEKAAKGWVRPHWRRGHWRSQAVGPGKLERKVLWIKPVYVNSSCWS